MVRVHKNRMRIQRLRFNVDPPDGWICEIPVRWAFLSPAQGNGHHSAHAFCRDHQHAASHRSCCCCRTAPGFPAPPRCRVLADHDCASPICATVSVWWVLIGPDRVTWHVLPPHFRGHRSIYFYIFLYSNKMALITSDCGRMRSLRIKWP